MKNLILASASQSRRQLLLNAGVEFSIEVSNVDEASIKNKCKSENAENISRKLAMLKATNISNRNKSVLVVGADQVLECEGVLYDKPVDLNEAFSHLASLRGKTHRLISSACVIRNNQILWDTTDSVYLTMRHLSDEFITDYLGQTGTDILSSVGGYRLEDLGAQLFTRVEGDFFTVLGLPLLPLLEFLRTEDILKI